MDAGNNLGSRGTLKIPRTSMTPEPLINTYAVLVPCGDGDLFVSGTLPLERTESIQDDRPDEQELA